VGVDIDEAWHEHLLGSVNPSRASRDVNRRLSSHRRDSTALDNDGLVVLWRTSRTIEESPAPDRNRLTSIFFAHGPHRPPRTSRVVVNKVLLDFNNGPANAEQSFESVRPVSHA